MSKDISSEDIEIIQDFIQESHDMLDQLEPTIIELGESCQSVNCWEILKCESDDCHRQGKEIDIPCWLHTGYVGNGLGICTHGSSEAECLSCQVFVMTNGDTETMNAIFRLFHSMKGSAGFLEFDNISRSAHAAENLLDLIRSGNIQMVPEHVDLLCKACDFANEALDYVEEHFNDEGMAEKAEEITSLLRDAIEDAQNRAKFIQEDTVQQGKKNDTHSSDEKASASEESEPDQQDLIGPEMIETFVLDAEDLLRRVELNLLKLIEQPSDEIILADLFREMHTFKGNCGFLNLGDFERLSHKVESVLGEYKEGDVLTDSDSTQLLINIVDTMQSGVADFSSDGDGTIDQLEMHLKSLDDLLQKISNAPPPIPDDAPRLGELLVEKGIINFEDIEEALEEQQKPLGDILIDMGKVTPELITTTLKEQHKIISQDADKKGKPKPRSLPVKRQDIRVDLEKLDNLINLIGEMVIAENMLVHNPDLEGMELENFNKAAQQMGKLVRELQEMAMIIRMIPVSGLFRRMIRLVHDLSTKSGKKVDLQLAGEETEIDKTVIETITDPLVHLLRNSLDHGLEPPEERNKAGKPEIGVLILSARHEEGEVWITLEDDGRGLNREKIIAKAIKNGLLEEESPDLSDKEVYNLIFQPGFSTAEVITNVSGRGVGMDVVKQNLNKIRGKVEVQSKPGRGTKITLRIPLTLAIIDGMLVRVGLSKCILPILNIREAFCPKSSSITITPDGEEIVRVRENFFPVIRLHEILGKEPDCMELEKGILIVLEYQDNSACLFVDEIMGQQQTVIKGLSDYIGSIPVISGCTILGNGQVCLILDTGNLVELKEGSEHAAALQELAQQQSAAEQAAN